MLLVCVCFPPKVVHEGKAYSGGETIDVTLGPLKSVHLQDSNLADVSGALIVANKPVAVFSGNLLSGESVH